MGKGRSVREEIRQLKALINGDFSGNKKLGFFELTRAIIKGVVKRARRRLSVVIFPLLIRFEIQDFSAFESQVYSQNGEDGIIKAIFRKIGTTNRFCVEFGIESTEGNSILLQKEGWNCLWMDAKGDGKLIKKEWIDAETINGLFDKYKVPTEFDLLSIDIDSNDYYVWKAIEHYSPRVVIIEYNSKIPATESKVVRYDPTWQWDGTDYMGASLLALKKLGESKGYTLITCDSNGVNSFFVRQDLVDKNFAIRNIKEIYRPPNYGAIHPASTRQMENC